MKTELIQQMKSGFDVLAQIVPDSEGVVFWFARDLQDPLGYARWENFLAAIQRAIESCETTGYKAADHFRGVTKLITHGKGGGFSAHPDHRGQYIPLLFMGMARMISMMPLSASSLAPRPISKKQP